MTPAERAVIDAHCEAETVLLAEIASTAKSAPPHCEQLTRAYATLHAARPKPARQVRSGTSEFSVSVGVNVTPPVP